MENSCDQQDYIVRDGLKKGKTMEGEVDPNAVTGGQIKETNGELY